MDGADWLQTGRVRLMGNRAFVVASLQPICQSNTQTGLRLMGNRAFVVATSMHPAMCVCVLFLLQGVP